jgi:ribose/xylose/arabinose/galactoside ABC-type transport system permease subunit
VAVVNKAKVVAFVVFSVKTVLLFGLASVLSNRLASIWPDHGEWFKKGAVVAILVPWIWWAAVPVLRAFGIYATDTH